jgi:hypothetical protein
VSVNLNHTYKRNYTGYPTCGNLPLQSIQPTIALCSAATWLRSNDEWLDLSQLKPLASMFSVCLWVTTGLLNETCRIWFSAYSFVFDCESVTNVNCVCETAIVILAYSQINYNCVQQFDTVYIEHYIYPVLELATGNCQWPWSWIIDHLKGIMHYLNS